MPQGTTFLLGRGWPNTDALKGKIWELRCELMSLRQRAGVSLGDTTSRGIPPSRAGLGCLGWLLCHSLVRREPLLNLIAGYEARIFGYPE